MKHPLVFLAVHLLPSLIFSSVMQLLEGGCLQWCPWIKRYMEFTPLWSGQQRIFSLLICERGEVFSIFQSVSLRIAFKMLLGRTSWTLAIFSRRKDLTATLSCFGGDQYLPEPRSTENSLVLNRVTHSSTFQDIFLAETAFVHIDSVTQKYLSGPENSMQATYT